MIAAWATVDHVLRGGSGSKAPVESAEAAGGLPESLTTIPEISLLDCATQCWNRVNAQLRNGATVASCQLTLSKTNRPWVRVGSFRPSDTEIYQATNSPA